MHSFTASVSWPEGELQGGRRKERLSLLRRRASGSSGGVERRMQSGKALPDPASGRLAVIVKIHRSPQLLRLGGSAQRHHPMAGGGGRRVSKCLPAQEGWLLGGLLWCLVSPSLQHWP